MGLLNDANLIEAYRKAIELELDEEFIDMLETEVRRRRLHLVLTRSAM
ncbi:sporulation histidine kinase inhibitor Sda [Paenibacillus aurantius]|uniref:Sporulation histidine kinase inhibitor Sda n=1 Tax=Paenibacillus aurantius TaxID=2918900 RepID=A0AA96LC14_9BACL|nr:sporulation histidine kinase inhibitor Sda [Paenibacillus aurantius]WNQ10942.1 sporulation histidine kinase inhibitor Sda [Paenibacillus aurantius]